MRELFSFCFEQITDPLALPLHPIAEWLILAVLHKIAYKLAFSKVGDCYHSGIISGGTVGSALHWLFRTIIFIAFWAGINVVIAVYLFITEHWRMIIGVICGIVLLALAIVLAYKAFGKNRDNKPTTNMPV